MEILGLKIKSLILSIVIAIVLSGFVIYAINSIHPSPKWEDYCGNMKNQRYISEPKILEEGESPQTQQERLAEEQEFCETNGGVWENNYCDYQKECREEHNEASENHRLIVFIVAVIAGLIAIGIGIALGLPSVSLGLMLGGTFLIFFGTASYWRNFNDWIRTLILGLVLIILIWLGYKKLQH